MVGKVQGMAKSMVQIGTTGLVDKVNGLLRDHGIHESGILFVVAYISMVVVQCHRVIVAVVYMRTLQNVTIHRAFWPIVVGWALPRQSDIFAALPSTGPTDGLQIVRVRRGLLFL